MSEKQTSRRKLLFILAAGAVGLAIILNVGNDKAAKANVGASATAAPAAPTSAKSAAGNDEAAPASAGVELAPLSDLEAHNL